MELLPRLAILTSLRQRDKYNTGQEGMELQRTSFPFQNYENVSTWYLAKILFREVIDFSQCIVIFLLKCYGFSESK